MIKVRVRSQSRFLDLNIICRLRPRPEVELVLIDEITNHFTVALKSTHGYYEAKALMKLKPFLAACRVIRGP